MNSNTLKTRFSNPRTSPEIQKRQNNATKLFSHYEHVNRLPLVNRLGIDLRKILLNEYYCSIACFQTMKDQVRVCKLWDQQLLIHIVIKCRPSFTKFPSLVYIDPKVSKIEPFENVKFYKEMYDHPNAVRHSVQMPYISLLILTFLNRCISVKTNLINTKLGNLVNFVVLFPTMWINSC